MAQVSRNMSQECLDFVVCSTQLIYTHRDPHTWPLVAAIHLVYSGGCTKPLAAAREDMTALWMLLMVVGLQWSKQMRQLCH
jgi:hypothetical protein